MDRRQFLRTSGLGSALAATGPFGCRPNENAERGSEASTPGPFELDEITITELQKGMKVR